MFLQGIMFVVKRCHSFNIELSLLNGCIYHNAGMLKTKLKNTSELKLESKRTKLRKF